jgi:TonB family protein
MFRKITLAILLASGFWPDIARCDDKLVCVDKAVDADASIAACTGLLDQSGQDMHARSQILVSLGNAYLRKKDFDHALADYDEAIKDDVSNADAFLHRGDFYWEKVQDETALLNYDEAVRLEPTPDHLLTRGRHFNYLLQSDKAIADLTRAIRQDSRLTEAYVQRGTAYSRENEFDLAIADFDLALKISPDHTRATTGRHNAVDAKADIKTPADFRDMLIARLQIQKSFPRQASRDNTQGTVKVTFVIARDGKLVSKSIVASSGSAVLDWAALDIVQRAQPFPRFPEGKESESFTVPLVFNIPKVLPHEPAAPSLETAPP